MWVRELRTVDAEGTHAVGCALARAALPLPADGLLVALYGDLGAGKTVFVKGVAIGLGIPPSVRVVSPTFTIARAYEVPVPAGWTLQHVDAYRLQGAEEIEAAGFEEMCGAGCLTCVEWAERVVEALPEDRIDVWITPIDTDVHVPSGGIPRMGRRIRLEGGGPIAGRVLADLAVPAGVEEEQGT